MIVSIQYGMCVVESKRESLRNKKPQFNFKRVQNVESGRTQVVNFSLSNSSEAQKQQKNSQSDSCTEKLNERERKKKEGKNKKYRKTVTPLRVAIYLRN